MEDAERLLTFSRLREQPELLTAAVSSPVFHADGTMTVLWEGDPGAARPLCATEWFAEPQPLEPIPGTHIWGADLAAPPLPRTICSYVRVVANGKMLLSPHHHPELHGPDLPPFLPFEAVRSTLVEDIKLPAPGLAGNERRIRIYVPGGFRTQQTYPVLFWLDAQSDVDRLHWVPGMTDTLNRQGKMPSVITVALDHGGLERPEEYLAGGSRNQAARDWICNTVVPYITAHYAIHQRWVVGTSNGASMAWQLALLRPDCFDGGLFISARHRDGLDAVLNLAEHWTGGGCFMVAQGTFGLGEQQALPEARLLVERLQTSRALVCYTEYDGYGHNFDAFYLMLVAELQRLWSDQSTHAARRGGSIL